MFETTLGASRAAIPNLAPNEKKFENYAGPEHSFRVLYSFIDID